MVDESTQTQLDAHTDVEVNSVQKPPVHKHQERPAFVPARPVDPFELYSYDAYMEDMRLAIKQLQQQRAQKLAANPLQSLDVDSTVGYEQNLRRVSELPSRKLRDMNSSTVSSSRMISRHETAHRSRKEENTRRSSKDAIQDSTVSYFYSLSNAPGRASRHSLSASNSAATNDRDSGFLTKTGISDVENSTQTANIIPLRISKPSVSSTGRSFSKTKETSHHADAKSSSFRIKSRGLESLISDSFNSEQPHKPHKKEPGVYQIVDSFLNSDMLDYFDMKCLQEPFNPQMVLETDL